MTFQLPESTKPGQQQDGHSHQLGFHPLTIEMRSSWPERSDVTVCGLAYTGPFFVDIYGGHGYGYADGEAHGSNINRAESYTQEEALEAKRKEVQQWCFRAIDRADLVFAWIEGIDCYGTLAEVGYARAKGKVIWIADPRRYEDMWFIYRMADKTVFTNIVVFR